MTEAEYTVLIPISTYIKVSVLAKTEGEALEKVENDHLGYASNGEMGDITEYHLDELTLVEPSLR